LTVLLADSPFGIFPLLILILVIPANLNAWIFGANRLYFSSGQAGILPPFWGRLTARGLPLNSLLGSLAVYIAVTVAAHYHGVRLATLVRLVNQNGLVLYAFSIFAYWKDGARRCPPVACHCVGLGLLLFPSCRFQLADRVFAGTCGDRILELFPFGASDARKKRF